MHIPTQLRLRFSSSISSTRTNPNHHLPLIDFGPFLHGSAADRKQIASTLDAALSSVGFIYLRNHGIEQSSVDACFQYNKRLFALSDKRVAPHSPAQSHFHGYSGIASETIRGRLSLKESFDCGNPQDEDQKNNWPSQELLPGFRDTMEDFFQDCAKLIHQLLECLSLSLNLSSRDSLCQYHARSFFNLSLLHYPPVSSHLLRSSEFARNPAHSDFGTLTLLFQDCVGGLEVADTTSPEVETSAELERRGRFRHVAPVPGTIVVNVGYLLMRWSNARWKSTVHRVSEPPRQSTEEVSIVPGGNLGGSSEEIPERRSIAFFGAPDPSTIVEALPGCWSETVPKRWKPLNAGQYLSGKQRALYA